MWKLFLFGFILYVIVVSASSAKTGFEEQLVPEISFKGNAPANLCLAEIGISEEEAEQYYRAEEIKDEKFACFIRCYFSKIGIMDEEGKLSVVNTSLLSGLEDARDYKRAKELITKCEELTGENTCWAAGKKATCLVSSGLFEHW